MVIEYARHRIVVRSRYRSGIGKSIGVQPLAHLPAARVGISSQVSVTTEISDRLLSAADGEKIAALKSIDSIKLPTTQNGIRCPIALPMHFGTERKFIRARYVHNVAYSLRAIRVFGTIAKPRQVACAIEATGFLRARIAQATIEGVVFPEVAARC